MNHELDIVGTSKPVMMNGRAVSDRLAKLLKADGIGHEDDEAAAQSKRCLRIFHEANAARKKARFYRSGKRKPATQPEENQHS